MIVTGCEHDCVDVRGPRIIDRPPNQRCLPERGKLLGGAEAAALAGSAGCTDFIFITDVPGVLVNEAGYTLEAAGIIDMFPHTAHVESIAVFKK